MLKLHSLGWSLPISPRSRQMVMRGIRMGKASRVTSFQGWWLIPIQLRPSARCIHVSTHTYIYIHSHMYLVLGCSFNSMHFNMHINEPDICTDATDTINREDIDQLHLSERCHVKFTDQKRDFLPNTWWIWVFPKIGLPLVIIHFSGIFPYKNHPAMGVPPFQETSI